MPSPAASFGTAVGGEGQYFPNNAQHAQSPEVSLEGANAWMLLLSTRRWLTVEDGIYDVAKIVASQADSSWEIWRNPASPEGTPQPTRTFFYWVLNLNISGINPPRLLINGRLVHEKQEVSIPLGVTLEQFDAAHRLLVFKDKTGALVTRSY